jgi:hypothetical protein
VLVSVGIICAIALADLGLLWRTIHGPLNGLTFVCAFLTLLSLPAMAFIGYRIYDLTQLRYEFDRNRLVINTGATKQIIPMRSVERVIAGLEGERKARIKGPAWPGCFVGPGDVQGVGLTLFYGVTPPHKQAIVVTPALAYGISPPDAAAFMDVFDTCRQLGPTVEVDQESVESTYVQWPIWRDYVAQGVLLGGVVLILILFAIVCFRYPNLPGLLPLHYDVEGRVDRIAPRSEVFALPIIGTITWALNGLIGAILYRRQRMASYLAWSGALIVQFLFLLALWNVVT